jgi:hypothetical protein
MKNIKSYSKSVSNFQGRTLPEEAILAGYGALINAYDLKVPLPEKLAAISHQHRRYDTDSWAIYTPRYTPEDTLAGNLIFALSYEGVDLGILNALFNTIEGKEIEEIVKNEPTGNYSRRIWFLYEWLTENKLNLNDATSGNFIDVLDSKQCYTASQGTSKRHRVNNNLPGVKDFCPLVKRTEKLETYIKKNLLKLAYKKLEVIHPDVLNRAAAFLLLKDSRASFAIEGENPSQDRTERWGQIIGQAGTIPLSIEELLRLQNIVLANSKYVKFGLRTEGGFIGVHDRTTGSPIPDHISAKYTDLNKLMNGLLATNEILRNSNMDAIISAAIIAFGFVFIHPFEDGNGRIHRYLLHNSFAEHGFVPKGMIFPVSAVILDRIIEYKSVLESYSKRCLKFIKWKTTDKGNVEVLNDTIDLYRYFDATNQVEFLYDCVNETITKVLPKEVRYLQNYDKLKNEINQRFDIPNYKISLLIRFLEQNKGNFSQRAKTKEFKDMNEEELNMLEELYKKFMLPNLTNLGLDKQKIEDNARRYGNTILHILINYFGKGVKIIRPDLEEEYLLDMEEIIDYQPEIVNIQDNNGQSPLHRAYSLHLPKVIKLLEEKGARKDIKDKLDNTPIDLWPQKELETSIDKFKIGGGILENKNSN